MSPKSSIAKKTEYHHGNLRSALIEAGREALKEVSAQDLSLRYLARIVGVSEAAPSRHFSGIADILASIAACGFRELASLRIGIRESGDTSLSKAYRMMRVYVEFAEREKGLFGLMIGPRIVEREAYPELADESGKSFRLFCSAIEALAVESGWQAADLSLVIHAAWSMEHGLATLIISDRAPHPDMRVPVARIIDFAIMSMLSAIIAGPDQLKTVMDQCAFSAPKSRSRRKPASA
ncbi:TetR/AcrR family transcriptional regulator [Paraburkholderia sp. ZP32-5]|uniref:TetR/AcrR family transcriptional regulator n=1 Tax=Paraburkholderia sp. ZP32-5 TaxID=2883245 RepID=UPI001F2415C1|nr:TetR/AcrR family transcriptional regulator [Paraburkholderia sp. ZP32-5]